MEKSIRMWIWDYRVHRIKTKECRMYVYVCVFVCVYVCVCVCDGKTE